ncbi:hypothetical protein GE21DRAFT_3315 [Neurospora crassa]|uniref:RNA binding protein Nrd1 n=2 Tax=Neurospora crassa TaxID=5141 RepID=Q7RY25_NEUCR|nr:RNA binding protein Nrd1 [Neurospora crassa OR74A]EAA27665.3 RNA binding protein Nrd1 [Neurospora crassa OR74A]KHE82699.1 hypothetical protein GE21DRAFT_3315 [Neurospora crassa]CAB91287.2 related to NRD1 protein [Neurospora crassa]|eukprot:XP_956901.3 RNA binding protein Nrd1 [Neurospora crassa OR74A]
MLSSQAAVAELEKGLGDMQNLKPPGVSGSKINSLTMLCLNNVQYESQLVQKLYTHYKKTPNTHKLGVLYVVDSVTRKWLEKAKALEQPVTLGAQDGTYAAGVHRVTELMPMFMNAIISSAPEDQKEKIKKLVDIWEKGQTFPPDMVNTFKEKLNAHQQHNVSTTPPGSPPPNPLASLQATSRPLPTPTTTAVMPSNILETLANLARLNANAAQSNSSAAAPAPAPAATAAVAPSPVQMGVPQIPPVTSSTPHPMFATSGQPSNGALPAGFLPGVGHPGMPYLSASQPAGQSVNMPPTMPFGFPAPAAQLAQPVQVPGAAPSANTATTVQLFAALAAQGIPLDKIASVMQLMGQPSGTAPAAPPQSVAQPLYAGYPPPPPAGGVSAAPAWEAVRHDESRDRNGYHDGMRSPNRPRGRSRSRSPRRWDVRGSPRARGNDRFDYGRSTPPRGHPDDRGRDRDMRIPEYRQRSPPNRRHESPGQEPPSEKWVKHDPTLPNGHIKVYSRTLFVGGVTCSEAELRSIFGRYGEVQTCIVNKEKRHAFVKMYYRQDAENAKKAMEENRGSDVQLRTRWGVGFGPRDCSDYQTGISVIPIHKLTEADRKWMLTAPYGGSGGQPITTGLVVEEPDIEIGAGVSSKAISRRMQTDKGGNHGPKSSRRDEEPQHPTGNAGGPPPAGNRWRHGREKHRNNSGDDRRGDRNDKNAANDDPIVMGLPGNITVGPNGINFPPNYAFTSNSTSNN